MGEFKPFASAVASQQGSRFKSPLDIYSCFLQQSKETYLDNKQIDDSWLPLVCERERAHIC